MFSRGSISSDLLDNSSSSSSVNSSITRRSTSPFNAAKDAKNSRSDTDEEKIVLENNVYSGSSDGLIASARMPLDILEAESTSSTKQDKEEERKEFLLETVEETDPVVVSPPVSTPLISALVSDKLVVESAEAPEMLPVCPPLLSPSISVSHQTDLETLPKESLPSSTDFPSVDHRRKRERSEKTPESSGNDTESSSEGSKSDDDEEDNDDGAPHRLVMTRPTRVMTRRTAAVLALLEEKGEEATEALTQLGETFGGVENPGSDEVTASRERRPRESSGRWKRDGGIDWPPIPAILEKPEGREHHIQYLRRILLSTFPSSLQPPPPSSEEREIAAKGEALETQCRCELQEVQREEWTRRRSVSTTRSKSRGFEEERKLLDLLEPPSPLIAEKCVLGTSGPTNLLSESKQCGPEDLRALLAHLCEDKIYVMGAWGRFYDDRQRLKRPSMCECPSEESGTAGVRSCRRGLNRSAGSRTRSNGFSDKNRSRKNDNGEPALTPSIHFQLPSSMYTPPSPCDVHGIFPPHSSFIYPHYSGRKSDPSTTAELSSESDSSASLPLVLTSEEKALYVRYVMSSGKLRHECPEPYQLLTSRAQLFRLRVDGNDVLDLP